MKQPLRTRRDYGDSGSKENEKDRLIGKVAYRTFFTAGVRERLFKYPKTFRALVSLFL